MQQKDEMKKEKKISEVSTAYFEIKENPSGITKLL